MHTYYNGAPSHDGYIPHESDMGAMSLQLGHSAMFLGELAEPTA